MMEELGKLNDMFFVLFNYMNSLLVPDDHVYHGQVILQNVNGQ